MIREKSRFFTNYDKIQQAEPTNVIVNTNGCLYAVLFNAFHTQHDSTDLQLVYNSLINSGTSKNNIFTLEGHGKTQEFVNAAASTKNLDSIVNSIRKKTTPNDKLLVYINSHGDYRHNKSILESYDSTICEIDFEQIFSDIPVNFAVFYFAQCFSGGFAERMGHGRNIGISNTTKDKPSYGRKQGIWPFDKSKGSFFTHYLFPKILETESTIENSFDFAVKKDTSILRFITNPVNYNPYKEIPQLIWENACPSQLYLNSNSSK